MQTLTISGINLDNNTNVTLTLKASNPFMLVSKYLKARKPLHIEDFTLINNEMHGGNSGINAGAYLCEAMEELTGMNLA
jgi:hypothetical protein